MIIKNLIKQYIPQLKKYIKDIDTEDLIEILKILNEELKFRIEEFKNDK